MLEARYTDVRHAYQLCGRHCILTWQSIFVAPGQSGEFLITKLSCVLTVNQNLAAK